MPRVIISAGHTSLNPGSVSGDLSELELARKISKHLTPMLRNKGILTLAVPLDLDLDKRSAWINNTGYAAEAGDILIELHINEGQGTGVEAWYGTNSLPESKTLAARILEAIGRHRKFAVGPNRPDDQHALGSISILQRSRPIGVLLECLYINNPDEQKFLRDDNALRELAQQIAEGIYAYFGLTPPEQAPQPQPEAVAFVEPVAEATEPITETEVAPIVAEEAEISEVTEAIVEPVQPPTPAPAPQPQPAPRPQAPTPRPIPTRPAPQQRAQPQIQQPQPRRMESAPRLDPAPTPDPFTAADDDFGFHEPDDFDAGARRPANNPSNSFAGGNSFGGNNSFNNNGGGFAANTGLGFGGGKQMSRDERKEMINKHYKRAFGKEPSQGDLNYFLNIGVTEEQLLKRIVESQDHADIVVNAQKYADLKGNYDLQETRTKTLERDLLDQRQIMEKLNSLLLQKNYALSEMQKRQQILIDKLEDMQAAGSGKKVQIDYKRSRLERLLSYFSKKLS